MHNITKEQMRTASPETIFESQKSDVEKAIEILKAEAEEAESDWDREMLEATAEYLQNEVL